jgi:hypothetical protein
LRPKAAPGLSSLHKSSLRLEQDAQAELKKRATDDSILGIAKLVLTDDVYSRLCKIPSANSISELAITVGDMCNQQQRDLGRLAGAVIDAILTKAKAGESIQKVSWTQSC